MNPSRRLLAASLALLSLLPLGSAQAQGVVVQESYFKASNTELGDWFGIMLAASGQTVVVGATDEDSAAVGLNGDQADNSADEAGAVYVFVRAGGSWSQEAYVKASNTDAGDSFGWALAIDGDTLVVGARLEDSSATGIGGNQASNDSLNSGAVYVFRRSAGVWTQEAYIKASNNDPDDFFGQVLALDGDTLVVGAPGEDSSAVGVGGAQLDNGKTNSGAVYVFTRSGTTWSQTDYIKAPAVDPFDDFGSSVAVSGDTLVVGSPLEDGASAGVGGDPTSNGASGSGAAYVYRRVGSTWGLEAYVKASNNGTGDRFGSRVTIDGDLLAVAAPFEASQAQGIDGDQSDDSGSLNGAVYLFERTGSTWAQVAYLKGSNTQSDDEFGGSLDLSGELLVVGAPGEGAQSFGVDGNQADNKMKDSGALYVFERQAGVWTQRAYVKQAYPNILDSLGRAVALDGTTLVGGSPFEASEGTGVDGNQTLNGSYKTGAAFVFDLAAPCGVVRYGAYDAVNAADLYSFDPPIPGKQLKLRLSGFRSGGTALVAIAAGPASVPGFLGGTLLLDPAGFGPLLATAIADGSGILSLPVPLGAGGLSFFLQAAMPDATKPGGWALSTGLEALICP